MLDQRQPHNRHCIARSTCVKDRSGVLLPLRCYVYVQKSSFLTRQRRIFYLSSATYGFGSLICR